MQTRQLGPGAHHRIGLEAGIGSKGDKQGFVLEGKIEHPRLEGRVGETLPQVLGAQACQGHETPDQVRIRRKKSEQFQRQIARLLIFPLNLFEHARLPRMLRR